MAKEEDNNNNGGEKSFLDLLKLSSQGVGFSYKENGVSSKDLIRIKGQTNSVTIRHEDLLIIISSAFGQTFYGTWDENSDELEITRKEDIHESERQIEELFMVKKNLTLRERAFVLLGDPVKKAYEIIPSNKKVLKRLIFS